MHRMLRRPPLTSRLLFCLLLGVLGLHVVFLLLGGQASVWRSAIANLSYLPAYILSALLAFRAARPDNPAAATWRWIGYGLVSWGSASALYFLIDTVLHLSRFPSVADVFYLATLPCIAIGILRLRRESQGWLNRLSVALDALLVMLMLGETLWFSSVRATVAGYVGQPFALGVSLAYPTADLLLCALLITLTLWRPIDLARRQLLLLAAGMGSFIFADMVYARLTGENTYISGTLLDVGWTLAATLFGWAAFLSGRQRPASTVPARLERWAPLVPHYAVLSAFTFYLVTHLRAADLGRVQVAVLLTIAGLFVLRQLLVLTHNQHLQLLLTHRAEHDPLTGVRNRVDLEARLQQLIDRQEPGSGAVGVMFVDLDRMKLINDTFGHPVGDLALREVAARLTAGVGHGATVSRFGGDEFVVILPDLQAPESAGLLATRLLEALGQPFRLGNETLSLTASIGVALMPDDATTAAQAIELADRAMYEAKQGGKNTWRFADVRLNARHVPQAGVEVQLRGALERGEFVLYFQPLVNLKSGAVDSFEALLRWFSPTLGQVSPATFIPIAESREMMGGIGRWVLRTAVREAQRWQTGPLPGVRVSVNVSATQFDAPDFVDEVRSVLLEHGLPGSALIIELTESAVLAQVETARQTMLGLKALGVQIALDDFGMGYSSLGQLRNLPVDVLKIDRSFVQESHQDQAAFIRTIVALGHSLHLAVVAEGIEDARTVTGLEALGCDIGQGYYFGRPLSVAEAVGAVPALESRTRMQLGLPAGGTGD